MEKSQKKSANFPKEPPFKNVNGLPIPPLWVMVEVKRCLRVAKVVQPCASNVLESYKVAEIL